MKKNNIWHTIWLIGLFSILLIILYLVINYKVKWEGKDLNNYLYFYKCNHDLCTTTEPVENYYSQIKCTNKNCPYIISRKDNYLILKSNVNENEYLFNYKTGEVVNDKYNKYSFMNSALVVKNENNKYGVIDFEGNVLVDFNYNRITDYKDEYVAYAENNQIGIINTKRNIDIKPAYQNVQLVNDNLYTYLEDGKYYIASYDTELPANNEKYDYIYAINNVLIVINNKKLDIMDASLNYKLLLKVDTFYEYTKEQERESLNIYAENNLVHFDVINEEGQVIKYIYDIKNNKLFS